MDTPRKKTHLAQLELLDLLPLDDVVATPSTSANHKAGQPLILALTKLFADPHNPRTEVPESELDELAEDIRQHGILQPIVVHPADAEGRHQIHFGARRWLAAQRIGLQEVPVVFRDAPSDAYAQVAENMKRHALSPLDLARFIRARVDAGESNANVAKRLGIDQTTLAHHLALLTLPAVLDEAMSTGRCTSPRTLYELKKLHADQPERVAEMVANGKPITRDAVAEIRDAMPARLVVNGLTTATETATATKTATRTPPRADQNAQMLARVNTLCARLEAALVRLSQTDIGSVRAADMAALRQHVTSLAHLLDRSV
jgi:ParB family transcriptional regulator, chromosome partitioning protein